MHVVVYGEIKRLATAPARGVRFAGIVGPGLSPGAPVMCLERLPVVDAQALRRSRDVAGPFVVPTPMPTAELASQLNLTAERFSRILHELAQAELSSIEGRQITLPSRERRQGALQRRRAAARPYGAAKSEAATSQRGRQ